MANQEAIRELLDLLPQIFVDADGLRDWLQNVPDGDKIVHNLPGRDAAPKQFFAKAVDILDRWKLLSAPEFWDPLETNTPAMLKVKAADLRTKFVNITSGITQNDRANSAQQITMMFVSANPVNEARIQVSREVAAIIESIERFNERFKLIQIQAASFDRLRAALIRHRPHVLHISCHGRPDGTLILEDITGNAEPIPKQFLLRLLQVERGRLQLVFLNADNSQVIAREIPPTIGLAIGCSAATKDRDAINFAVAFYEGLAFGRSVEQSFDLGSLTCLDYDTRHQLFPDATRARELKFS